MNITAVSVCVNYSDFAAWTIPANKDLFSKWIIITDTKDFRTKQLCEYYNIQYIQTDIFYQDGTFKKFKGINQGLEKVRNSSEWVLFLDIDIVLPPFTKRVFNELELDKKCLYGIDRVSCVGIENWINYLNYPDMLMGNWLLSTGSMKLGERIIHLYGQKGDNGKYGGYKPLGFFQLCHKSQFDFYPDTCEGANHCDIVFSDKWSRSNRILIPEIIGVHLESENNEWGINWSGRKSDLFLPESFTTKTSLNGY